MLKNKYFIILLLIFLLFIIPAASASNNNTDLIEIDIGNTISNNNPLNENVDNSEDILSVTVHIKNWQTMTLKMIQAFTWKMENMIINRNMNTETLHLLVKTHQKLLSTVTEVLSI